MLDFSSAAKVGYRPLSSLADDRDDDERTKKSESTPSFMVSGAEAPDEPGLLGQISDVGLSGLAIAGNILDVPGSMVRDVLTWVPGGVEAQNPFDQIVRPWASDNRVSGEEILKENGLAGEDTWGGFLGGLGLEVALDPLTYLSFGTSAYGKAGKAASKAGLTKNAKRVANKRAGKELGKEAGRKIGSTSARQTLTPRMLIDDMADLDDAALSAARENAKRPHMVELKQTEDMLRAKADEFGWDANQLDAAITDARGAFTKRAEDAAEQAAKGAGEAAREEALKKFKRAGGTDAMLDEKLGGFAKFSVPFLSKRLGKKHPWIRERIIGALDMNPEDLAKQDWFESFMGGIRGTRAVDDVADIRRGGGPPDTPGGGPDAPGPRAPDAPSGGPGPDMPSRGPDSPAPDMPSEGVVPDETPRSVTPDEVTDVEPFKPPSPKDFSKLSNNHKRFQAMMSRMTKDGLFDNADEEVMRTVFSQSSLGPMDRVYFRGVDEIPLSEAKRKKISETTGVPYDKVQTPAGRHKFVPDVDSEGGMSRILVSKKKTGRGSGTTAIETLTHELFHAFLYATDEVQAAAKVDVIKEFDGLLQDGTLAKYFNDNYSEANAKYFLANPHEAFVQYATDSVLKRKGFNQPPKAQALLGKVRSYVKKMLDTLLKRSADGLSPEAVEKMDAMADLVGGFITPEEYIALFNRTDEASDIARKARKAVKGSPDQAVEAVEEITKRQFGVEDETIRGATSGTDIRDDIQGMLGVENVTVDGLTFIRSAIDDADADKAAALIKEVRPDLAEMVDEVFGARAAAAGVADEVADAAPPPIRGRDGKTDIREALEGAYDPELGLDADGIRAAIGTTTPEDVPNLIDMLKRLHPDQADMIDEVAGATSSDGASIMVDGAMAADGALDDAAEGVDPALDAEGAVTDAGQAADEPADEVVEILAETVEPVEDPAKLLREINGTAFDNEDEARKAAELATAYARQIDPNSSLVGRSLTPRQVIKYALRKTIIEDNKPKVVLGKVTKKMLEHSTEEAALRQVEEFMEFLPKHMQNEDAISLRKITRGKNRGQYHITLHNKYFVDYVDAQKIQSRKASQAVKPTRAAVGKAAATSKRLEEMRENAGKEVYGTEQEARNAALELNASLPPEARAGVSYVAVDKRLVLDDELAEIGSEISDLRQQAQRIRNEMDVSRNADDQAELAKMLSNVDDIIARRMMKRDDVVKQIDELGDGRFQVDAVEVTDVPRPLDELPDADEISATRNARIDAIENDWNNMEIGEMSPALQAQAARTIDDAVGEAAMAAPEPTLGGDIFERTSMPVSPETPVLGSDVIDDVVRKADGLRAMTKVELRDLASKSGIKVSGNKEQLVQRLVDELPAEELSRTAMPGSNLLPDSQDVMAASQSLDEKSLAEMYPAPLVRYAMKANGIGEGGLSAMTNDQLIERGQKIADFIRKDDMGAVSRPQSLEEFPSIQRLEQIGFDVDVKTKSRKVQTPDGEINVLRIESVDVLNTPENAEAIKKYLVEELVEDMNYELRRPRGKKVPDWARDEVRKMFEGKPYDEATVKLAEQVSPGVMSKSSAARMGRNAEKRVSRAEDAAKAREAASYTRDELMAMTNAELKKVSKDLGAKHATNKQGMVDAIMRVVPEEKLGAIEDATPQGVASGQAAEVADVSQEAQGASEVVFTRGGTQGGRAIINATDGKSAFRMEGKEGEWSITRIGDWKTKGKAAARTKTEIVSGLPLRDAKVVVQKLASGELDAESGFKFQKLRPPKPMTAAQLQEATTLSPILQERAIQTLKDQGLVFGRSFFFKASPSLKKSILKEAGPIGVFGDVKPVDVKEMLDEHASEIVPARPVAQRGWAESQGDAGILFASENGESVIEVRKKFHDTIMKYNKDAKPFIGNDSSIVYKKGDEVVGLLLKLKSNAGVAKDGLKEARRKIADGEEFFISSGGDDAGRMGRAKDLAGNAIDYMADKIRGMRDSGEGSLARQAMDAITDEQTMAKVGVGMDTIGGVVKNSAPFRLLRAHLDPRVMGGYKELDQAVGEERYQAIDEAVYLTRSRMAPVAQQFLKKDELNIDRLTEKFGDATKAQAELVKNYNRIIRYLEQAGPLLDKGDGARKYVSLPEELADLKPALDEMRVALDEVQKLELAAGIKSPELNDMFLDYLPRQLYRFPADRSSKGNIGKVLEPGSRYQVPRRDWLRDIPGGTATLNEISIDPAVSGIRHAAEGKQLSPEQFKAAKDYIRETYGGGQAGRGRQDDFIWNLNDDDTEALTKFIVGLDPRHAQFQVPLYKLDPVQNVMNRMEAGIKAAAAGDFATSLFAKGAVKTTEQPGTKTLLKTLEEWSVDGTNKDTMKSRIIGKMGDTFIAEKQAMQEARDQAARNRAAKEVEMMGPETVKDGGWGPDKRFPVRVNGVDGVAEQVTEGQVRVRFPDAEPELVPVEQIQGPLVTDDEVLKRFTVEEQTAQAANRYVKGFTSPEYAKRAADIIESVTNLYKANLTIMWPAFHVRNFISGMYNNYILGATDPRFKGRKAFTQPVRDADALVRGQTIEDVLSIPMIKARGITDEAEAMEVLRQEIAANKLVDYGQGLSGDVIGEDMSSLRSQFVGSEPITLRQQFTPPPRPTGTTKLDAINPLRGSGIGDEAADTFLPYRYGRKIGNYVEGINRTAPFIAYLRQGMDPREAARLVMEAQFDYSRQTPTDRLARRVFPFWSYTKNIIPFTVMNLARQPGGPVAQTIRATSSAGTDKPVPTWIASQAAIPFGSRANIDKGDASFITGLGLGFEDPMSLAGFLGGDFADSGRAVLSRMNPLIKAPVEYAFGESTYFDGPGGGRDLKDMDPTWGRILSNINTLATGEETKGRAEPIFGNDLAEHVLANTPFARVGNTLRTMTDPRKLKNPLKMALNLGTGVKVTDVSEAAWDADLQNRATEMMKEMGARDFVRTYFPDYVKERMDEGELSDVQDIEELMKWLSNRAKERAAAKE